MNINDYQNQALRTWNKQNNAEINLAVCSLGLVGEAGEYSELIKKWLGHGHNLNKDECKKRTGRCSLVHCCLCKRAWLFIARNSPKQHKQIKEKISRRLFRRSIQK